MNASMVVAITGASGFIGRYAIEALSAAGYRPISLGRGGAGTAGVEHRATDYSSASLMGALEGVDAIVHLAGRRMTREDDPVDLAPFFTPNVLVMKHLTEAAAAVGAQRLVFASTIAVYTPTGEAPYSEDAPVRPLNAYGLSKLAAEHYLDALAHRSGFSALSLRFSAIYGDGEKGTPALMSFVNQAQLGQTLNIKGDPNYEIDELYVRDAAAAIVSAVERTSACGTINIGSGVGARLLDIAETVNEVFGEEGNLTITGSPASTRTCRRMSIDRAADMLGWTPSYSLREGLLDFKGTSSQRKNMVLREAGLGKG